MPTLLSDREAAKAERKAEQRAALARAKQWHEERQERHNSLPVLHDPTSSKTLKPSPKKANTSTTKRVHSKKSTAPAMAEAIPNCNKSSARAEARAKARAWFDEKKTAPVPAAIVTKRTHRVAVVEEDSSTSDFSDDFQTALTRSSTKKDSGQILVSKADLKKALEMKNEMKNALQRFEDICEPYEESVNSMMESMDLD